MDRSTNRVQSSQFALVPGPSDFDEPCSSIEVMEFEKYPAEVVKKALDEICGPSCSNGEHPDRNAWFWTSENGCILIGFSTMYNAGDTVLLWSGRPLDIDCTVECLIMFWQEFQTRFPTAWLHDAECRLYKPETFLQDLSE